MTNGGLWRASQPLAAHRLSLGLVEASRRGARQRQPEVRQRRNPGVRLELRACEADRLTRPRLRALGSPLLCVEQREQPEAADVAVGDVRRVGPLDGLQRDLPRLVELTGEEQRLRQAREDRRRSRTSAPARAAATARRPCSTAAPTSPRSIAIARVTSTTASTYGDHSCGRSRRARSATASSRWTSTSGCASNAAPAAAAAGSTGCSSSSSEGSQRTQPRNCSIRPPQMNSKMGLDEQLGHHLGVPGGGGVLDRVLDKPVRTAPSRSAAAQLSRGLALELEPQNLAEQMVIAVPLSAALKSHQEHVRAGELRKHGGRVLAAQHRVAQLRREAPEHRGPHQKVPCLRRERRQNLGGQIVADMPSAAGERPHPLVRVLEVAQPQRRQVQARRASPRSARRANSTLSRDSSIPSRTNSSRASSTVNASSRARISVSARSRAASRAPIAGSERVDTTRRAFGRQPLDRVRDRTQRRLAPHRVEVVEHDRHRTPEATRPFISSSTAVSTCTPRTARRVSAPSSETLTEPVHGRRQVHPQPHRIIVSGIKRHPDDWLRTLDAPRPHQRRLAITDPRVEHRQHRSAVVIEHLKQARPAQHPRVNPRQHQLRLDHPQPLSSHPRRLGAHSIPLSKRPIPTARMTSASTRTTVNSNSFEPPAGTADERRARLTTARWGRWVICGPSTTKTSRPRNRPGRGEPNCAANVSPRARFAS